MNYRDIADKPESDRIRDIVNGCRARPGGNIAFLVDDDSIEPGKADRYMKKIRNLCPDISETKRMAGPVAGVTSVFVTYPKP